MAVSLKHTTQAVGTDAGNGEIRKAQWNEEHTLTAAANTVLGAVSAGAVGEITCTAAGRALLDDADAAAQRVTLSAAGTGVSNTFSANQIIEVTDNTNAALRVTQLGTGNAIIVEDSTNPDSTPFVVNSSGSVGIGTTAPDALLSVNGIASFGAGAAATPSIAAFGDLNTGMWYPAADTVAVSTGGTEALRVNSSQQLLVGGTTADAKLTVTGVGTTSTTPSTTTDIDATLGIRSSGFGSGNGGMLMFGAFHGYFGAIKGFLQNGSGPLGAIDFYTRNGTADTTLTRRMRIDFNGNIGIGTGSPDALLSVNGIASFGAGAVATPSITAFGDLNTGMWYPAADTIAWSTGGSERMRIRSDGNIGIGGTGDVAVSAFINRNLTGGTSATGVLFQGNVLSDATTGAVGFTTTIGTQAATFSTSVQHYRAVQGTLGAGSTVSSQLGFHANSSLIGATVNYGFFAGDTAAVTSGKTAYGFYSAINTATGGGTTYGFYAAGTARNLFSGDVQVFGAGGLGYTTGSGGAVTQATSRTTGVTLNKTNGAITLVSAAGSTTWQSFTVTNSTVAATDTVIVSQKSGTDLYMISVTAVAAGSFRISFATTGGTTTEQPVFNFAVIKAVTA